MGGSRTGWCADYWRGEYPVQGWWWRGSQKPNKPSKPPEIDKNDKKTGSFADVLALKTQKTPFFAQKYLTRYTHERFFEEYTNFEAHYLSHCRVIPKDYRGVCRLLRYMNKDEGSEENHCCQVFANLSANVTKFIRHIFCINFVIINFVTYELCYL